MTDGARAVELFLDEAWAANSEGRYRPAVAAAERAVRLAQELDDPALLVRALVAEATPLRMLGDKVSRLVGETCDLRVRIPTTSTVESLNASVAAAVSLAEVA